MQYQQARPLVHSSWIGAASTQLAFASILHELRGFCAASFDFFLFDLPLCFLFTTIYFYSRSTFMYFQCFDVRAHIEALGMVFKNDLRDPGVEQRAPRQ